MAKYSDADLQEFKILIEAKLEKAKQQLGKLAAQIEDAGEEYEDSSRADMIDDSNYLISMAFLQEAASRQQKYVESLSAALVRIRNKTYGICSVTGELIDKRRLIAVPTTTKSLMAKIKPLTPMPVENEEEEEEEKPTPKKKAEPKVISKVTARRKIGPASDDASHKSDDDDDWMDEFVKEEYNSKGGFKGKYDENDEIFIPDDDLDNDELKETENF